METKEALLELIVEMGEIRLKSTAMKLNIDEKLLLGFAYELEKEGWIENVDRNIDDPRLIFKKRSNQEDPRDNKVNFF